MTRKTLNIIIVALGVIGAVALVYFIVTDEKEYVWNESYLSTSKEPYGTFFIRSLLEKSAADGDFTERRKNSLKKVLEEEKHRKDSRYVFVGESLFLSSDDKKALIDFISEGNTAFIAAGEVPDFISDLYETECGSLVVVEGGPALTVTMNFYHPQFAQKFGYRYSCRIIEDDIPYPWVIFDRTLFCDSTKNLTPLGFQEASGVNFMRFRHGKGMVYLHSNPLVFTNYFLVQEQKLEYASSVFAHLNAKNTIWEEYGKIPAIGTGDKATDSPFYYIMQQPSLKYAWWLGIATVLLYVLFAAKRTQRVIPVLEGKTNTSLEFVKMISALHFRNKDHIDMARKKMKYFLYFIRSRYGIHGHPFSEEMALRLSEKSRVPMEDVQAVFKFNRLIEEGSNGVIDASRLSNFYDVIENFYKKCK